MKKLIHIFGPKGKPDEGVWSLKYVKNPTDELTAIFDTWDDPEGMYKFCVANLDNIQQAFGYAISPLKAANELMDEAADLLDLLVDLGKQTDPETTLQVLFKPLDNREYALTELQLSKGSAKDRKRTNPKLRIYAVRIAENTYVVVGGAIKLTHTMAEGLQTKEQLDRLTMVRNWLRHEEITFPEDLKSLL